MELMLPVTSASRMTYAFARDGGLPFSGWFRKVSSSTMVPVNSLVVVCVLSILFTVYSHVYATITAACTILLYISYVLPTCAGLVAHGRWWTVMGPWQLGIWFKPLALLGVVGSVGVLVIGIQPPSEKAGYVVLAFMAFLLVYWLVHARKHFPGPPVDLKSMQEGK